MKKQLTLFAFLLLVIICNNASAQLLTTCSGIPSAGTTAASSTTICQTGSTSLLLAGASLDPGLTYQWQQDTNGGGFVNIAGATSATYNTPVLYSPLVLQFRCVVTCTASGLSATSIPVTVNVKNNPPPPGAITGPAAICSGATVTFAILPVAGAVSYDWGYTTSHLTGSSTTNSFTATASTSTGAFVLTVRTFDGFCYSVYRSKSLVIMVCNGINEEEEAKDIIIAPNPTESTTTITFSEEQKNTTVLISDILGNTIQQLTTNNQQLILDMSSLAKGIYFLQINNDKGTVNKKLIKQ